MRFRILKIWLLVTAVIASLSLVSCKKDCWESKRGKGLPALNPAPDTFSFYIHFIDAKTGKSLLGDGSDAKLQAKDISLYGSATGLIDNDLQHTNKDKNYIFGPYRWQLMKGNSRIQVVYDLINKNASYPFDFSVFLTKVIECRAVAKIIDECNSEIVGMDYFYQKTPSEARSFSSSGTGQGNTLRIEVEL